MVKRSGRQEDGEVDLDTAAHEVMYDRESVTGCRSGNFTWKYCVVPSRFLLDIVPNGASIRPSTLAQFKLVKEYKGSEVIVFDVA